MVGCATERRVYREDDVERRNDSTVSARHVTAWETSAIGIDACKFRDRQRTGILNGMTSSVPIRIPEFDAADGLIAKCCTWVGLFAMSTSIREYPPSHHRLGKYW